MTQDDRKPSASRDPAAPAKKPYVKPAYRHEPVFETMALACGKINTSGACKSNKKTS